MNTFKNYQIVWAILDDEQPDGKVLSVVKPVMITGHFSEYNICTFSENLNPVEAYSSPLLCGKENKTIFATKEEAEFILSLKSI